MTNFQKAKNNAESAATLAYLWGAQDLKEVLKLVPEGQIALADERVLSHFEDLTELARALVDGHEVVQ